MGTLTGTSIIDKVALTLQDVTNVWWSRAELLAYLNEGQRAVVAAAPQSSASISIIPLVSGSRQTIPADGWTLLDVYRNIGDDGSTPNRAVRAVSRRIMDAHDPYWHMGSQQGVVQNFVFDQQDPKHFWVYPPSNGLTNVEICYAKTPTALASEGSVLTVSDEYEPALVAYMLFRACQKVAEWSPGPEIADMHYKMFVQHVSAKQAAEMANSPNQSLLSPKPEAPGGQS